MSTDLSLLKSSETTSDVNAIQGIIAQSEYLPYISLMGPTSDLVKKSKVGQGRFVLQLDKDNFIDLGPEIDVLVMDARTKAVDLRGDRPISFFNSGGENFQKLVAYDEGFKGGMSNVLYGLEFLVHIPGLVVATIPGPVYATFFFNNKTLRNAKVSKPMYALVGSMAFVKTKFIETKEHSWWGIETPVASSKPVDVPPIDELLAVKNKFKATTIEPELVAAEAAPASTRAR